MRAYAYKIKKKRLSRKAKFRIFLACFLLLIIGIGFYYFKIVCPIVITLSEEKVRSLSTKVISSAVAQVLVEDAVNYKDIVDIKYDNNNDVKSIEVNSVQVNMIVRRATELVQFEMDTLGKEGITVAMGTFTGIPFLFGVGPNISLQLVPVGTVNTNFLSSFQSVGINQSLHKLYFKRDGYH